MLYILSTRADAIRATSQPIEEFRKLAGSKNLRLIAQQDIN
jgi:hypothetical protein